MKIVALGVRGSTAAPGPEFLRYGGHTSCLAVYGNGDVRPRLILDAGTGLRDLPRLLADAPFRGDIVLTHLHWDHVHGLPFCSAVDREDAQVRLFVPVGEADEDPAAVLRRSMSPPFFPIGPEQLLGEWQFESLRPGRLGPAVTVAAIVHKGGAAHGIRVELDGATLAYLPDHALHSGSDPAHVAAATQFVRSVDVLVHDAQFVAAEDGVARAYGHATIEAACEFADSAEVGRLILSHHAPARSDDEIDAMAACYVSTPGGRPVEFARQGHTYDVSPTLFPAGGVSFRAQK